MAQRNISPPSLRRLAGKGLPPVQPLDATPRDLLFAPRDWGNPGWLDNFSVKEHDHAVSRDLIQYQHGTGSAETLKLLREHQSKVDREYRDFVNRGQSLCDNMGEGDDEEGSASSEDDEDRGRQKKRRQSRKATTTRPKIQPPPPLPEEYRVDWAQAHNIFRLGLENASINKSHSSKYKYTALIPGLEGEVTAANPAPFRLRPHQREAIGWWRHHSLTHKCFLLADDMGLGKTAVTTGRIQLELLEAQDNGRRARFLIVVPPSLLPTWLRELGRCDSIKVLKYHTGIERYYTKAQIEEYDVVLTSYATLSNQYTELKKIQRDFLDIKSGHQYMVEKAELKLWQRKPKTARKRDDEWKLRTARIFAPLFNILFDEQILDEAHAIKNPDVVKAYGVSHIRSRSRVCITGTPLQNGYKDMYPLFRFMRLEPFARKPLFELCFLKKIKGKKTRKRLQQDIELVLAAIIASVSLRRLKSAEFDGAPMTGIKHWHELNLALSLCPQAQELQRETEKLWDNGQRFAKEQEAREAARERRRNPLEEAAAAGNEDTDKSDKDIFRRIHEAKANCIHLRLLEARYSETGDTELEGRREIEHNLDMTRHPHRAEGPVAEDHHVNRTSARALTDAQEYALNERYSRRQVSGNKREQANRNRDQYRASMSQGNAWMSDKLVPLVATIKQIFQRVDAECRGLSSISARKEHRARNKIIVFGEYLASLDLLEIGIEKEIGCGVLRFDGTCSETQRDHTRAQFEEEGKDFMNLATEPDDCPILLATSKAAAEGLTLVHARHIIIMGPNWNPYVEDQCIGRAARLGQVGQVIVYRLLMKRSIEQRIADVGAVKRKQISSLLNEDNLHRNVPRLQGWSLDHFIRVCQQNSGGLASMGMTAIPSAPVANEQGPQQTMAEQIASIQQMSASLATMTGLGQ